MGFTAGTQAGPDGVNGLLSLAAPLNHNGSNPQRHVATTSSDQSAAGGTGELDRSNGGRGGRRYSSVTGVSEAQPLETPSSPAATYPPWHPPDLPRVSHSVVPSPSVHQASYAPPGRHPTVGRSSPTPLIPSAFDKSVPLSPYYLERTNSDESLASASAPSLDDSSMLGAEEDLVRADHALRAVGDVAHSMASNSMFLMCSNVDQMLASLVPDRPSQIFATPSQNSNDLVSLLSTDMDLRSFSEAWAHGLQTHVESLA